MKYNFMPAMQLAPKSETSNKTSVTSETPAEKPAETPAEGTVPRETPPPAEVQEPTSEKLESLKAAMIDCQTRIKSAEPGTSKFTELMMEAFVIGKDIDAEKAHIKKLLLEQEIAAKRNARIALIDNVIAAYDAHLAAQANKELSLEEQNAAYDAFKQARETVANELLAKFPLSTPSKKAVEGLATGAPSAPKGDKGAQIIERFLAKRAEGKPDTQAKKEIIEEGFARGTVGAVVLAWQQANGEK